MAGRWRAGRTGRLRRAGDQRQRTDRRVCRARAGRSQTGRASASPSCTRRSRWPAGGSGSRAPRPRIDGPDPAADRGAGAAALPGPARDAGGGAARSRSRMRCGAGPGLGLRRPGAAKTRRRSGRRSRRRRTLRRRGSAARSPSSRTSRASARLSSGCSSGPVTASSPSPMAPPRSMPWPTRRVDRPVDHRPRHARPERDRGRPSAPPRAARPAGPPDVRLRLRHAARRADRRVEPGAPREAVLRRRAPRIGWRPSSAPRPTPGA